MPEDAKPICKYRCARCGSPRDGLEARCAGCGWLPAVIHNLPPVVRPPSDAKEYKPWHLLRLSLVLFFCIPAAIGFVASLILHLATFVFIDNPLDHSITDLSRVRPLGYGIFVVGVLAIIAALSSGDLGDRRQFQRNLRELLPGWLHVVCVVVGTYALFNFFFPWVYLNAGGQPEDRTNGNYVLQEHGRIIRQLTREEFYRHKAYVVRSVSGHLMAMYFFALVWSYASLRSYSRRRGSG